MEHIGAFFLALPLTLSPLNAYCVRNREREPRVSRRETTVLASSSEDRVRYVTREESQIRVLSVVHELLPEAQAERSQREHGEQKRKWG